MDEDEDVVYEGSPIFRHLQDTGFTDFETSELCRITPSLEDEIQQHQEGESSNKNEWPNVLPGLFNSFFDPFTKRKKEENKFEETMVKSVLNSNLISEDDRLILEHFLPSWSRATGSNKANGTHNIEEFSSGISAAILVGLLSIIYGALNETWIVTMILAFLFFTREASRYYVSNHYRVAAERQIAAVAALKKNNLMISKAIRLLQEVQLIARGFVLMVGGGNSSSCGEVESSPQYLHLHSFLHPAIACLFAYLHDVHSCLNARPKTIEYPVMDGLFDNLPDLLSDEDRKQLKVLKDLSTLSKLQTSAVLTKFLLSFEKDNLYQIALDQEEIFPLRDTKLLDSMSLSLETKINYTRSYWLREDTEGETTSKVSYEDKKTDVYIAVHSLSLHMQAALYKVQEMELRFDSCDINKVADVGNVPPYELVCEQLAAVKMELESCMGCWEEAQQRIIKKYHMEEDSTETNLGEGSSLIPNMGEEVSKDNASKKTPIVLFDMADPVIQDEVFEAYIDQEYSARKELDTEDDLLKQSRRAEREKLKRNSAHGKRVLKELQPILVKRREMWERREELAVQRQHQDPIDLERLTLQQQENQLTDCQNKEKVMPTNPEDSDEERLEDYRRIRRLMDEEDKEQDVNNSKTVKRRNIFSHLSHHKNAASEEDSDESEEDSDEERLRQYRTVRAALDQQENDDNEKQICERKYQNINKIPINSSSNLRDNVGNVECISDYKENLICNTLRSHALSVPNNVSFPKMNDEQYSDSEVNQNNTDEGYNSLVGIQNGKLGKNSENKDREDELNANANSDLNGNSETQLDTKDENFHCGSQLEETINRTEHVRQHNENMSEETFGCGSDSSDSECGRSIDWSVVPPPRQLNNMEERLNHLSVGAGMLGFQAQVAARAVAAQAAAAGRLGTAGSNVVEETFGGVGEGEEEFLLTDDEEDNKDN